MYMYTMYTYMYTMYTCIPLCELLYTTAYSAEWSKLCCQYLCEIIMGLSN